MMPIALKFQDVPWAMRLVSKGVQRAAVLISVHRYLVHQPAGQARITVAIPVQEPVAVALTALPN